MQILITAFAIIGTIYAIYYGISLFLILITGQLPSLLREAFPRRENLDADGFPMSEEEIADREILRHRAKQEARYRKDQLTK